MPSPPVRTRAALAVGRLASTASKLLRRGNGAVIGGKVTLRIDPGALAQVTAGRAVTVVTGTNGKTTTTRLLAEALGARHSVTATRGANMPAGLVSVAARPADEIVLEVDELYVPAVVRQTRASMLVLLNISRDQLDRITEIRRIAELWRDVLATPANGGIGWPLLVVANADDPLVVWAVGDHQPVAWVAGGYRFTEDAALCPACGRIRPIAADGTWTCECGLSRPHPHWTIDGDRLIGPDHQSHLLDLSLPGSFNRANAAMAIAAASARHVPPAEALVRVAAVDSVAGRFLTRDIDGHHVRLLMGKNPASWAEMVALLDDTSDPVVICLNARTADGRDTSWIWDVPFDTLAGRTVIASGDRRLDLALRLDVGGVANTIAADPLDAVRALPPGSVDLIATYTAFHDILKEFGVSY